MRGEAVKLASTSLDNWWQLKVISEQRCITNSRSQEVQLSDACPHITPGCAYPLTPRTTPRQTKDDLNLLELLMDSNNLRNPVLHSTCAVIECS
jgi:hypothetical protein